MSAEVIIAGELTIYSASQHHDLLSTEWRCDATPLELDLAQVTEMDTAGLQLLLMLRRRSRAAGRQLRITAASTVAREVLTLCGLADLLVPKAAEDATS